MISLSIIDIGSNTIHLLIVEIINKDKFHILYEDKEHLRLGAELAVNKAINSIKIKETLDVLKKYIHISNLFNSHEIIAVATEALRIAENSQYIIELIKKNLNLQIKLLSSHEEAFLSFSGVKKVYNLPRGIIVDSGGASTEFIAVKDNKFITSTSIPLGAINVYEQITTNLEGRFTSCSLTEDYFYHIFSKINWLKEYNNSTLIGIGGTFKNLRKIHKHLAEDSSSNSSMTKLSSNDLMLLCTYVKNLSFNERKVLKGLSPKRSDIILGGCELLNNFIQYINFQPIIITESGLRTGILSHYINTLYNPRVLNHGLCMG